METKKLSRTVRKRLNKRMKFQINIPDKTNLLESPPAIPKPEKKTIATTQPNTKEELVSVTKSKKNRRQTPQNRLVYINRNYEGSDPNSVGGRVQAELIELRKQSKNIKSASDLTESQAHVIKRQITRLQGAVKEKVFKRPKTITGSINDAAKELQLLMEKQQNSTKNKKNSKIVV